ncbi:hypothetical protein LTR08_003855 [Meristemomyces frigidus]|nr:hypothetical protein LTR08_003855 [Meristemomyces frigidus]
MAVISVITIAVVASFVLIVKHFQNIARNRLPKDVKKLPGPKGLPFIGSVLDLPKKNSWMRFHEWGHEYGPIYQVNLAGVNHVWITRDSVAHDLLAKRSSIYSDRPYIPALAEDNRTSGQYLPLMSRNETWSRQRRFAKQAMDNSQKASFHGYPELESIRLLTELMIDPSRYNDAMESYIARVTSRLAWGTSTSSDELKQRARELLIGVSPTGAFGNKLPFIMSLPEKLISAKAWENRRSRTERKFFETMQQDVQKQLDRAHNSPRPTLGNRQQSWTRMFLENKTSWGFSSDLEAALAVGMHGIAGALTIAAPMQSFCLAICHHPQYQPMLHAEIDKVLGDRMPTVADMPDMPVLRAFIRETMRWRPPLPTGIPHELVKDDVYEGYHIPAGSVMHPLEWSISRDPEGFPQPDEFNPLRWLDPDFPTYQEPLTIHPTIARYSQFGYGLRKCQGMAVAEADLFVGLGSIAWLFSMEGHTDGPESRPQTEKKVTDEPFEKQTEAESDAGLWVHAKRGVSAASHLAQDKGDLVQLSRHRSSAESPEKAQHERYVGDKQEKKGRPTMHTNDSGIWLPEATLPDMALDAAPERQSTNQVDRPSYLTAAVNPKAKLASKATPKDDPTMNFSTLLIAKPMPFKFKLEVRNKARAEQVVSRWLDLKMKGEFPESRTFWAGGNSHAGDAEFGWGEVFA